MIFLFLLLTTLITIWAERRIIGRMQNRPGPNRAGPVRAAAVAAGRAQAAAEGRHHPAQRRQAAVHASPRPVARSRSSSASRSSRVGPVVSIFGHHTPLQLTDLPVAVLLVLAMSSMAIYGIVLAGWASASPYSLLGALRSSAQVISYEIAMGLSFVPVFLYAGSLSTTGIVQAQATARVRVGGVIFTTRRGSRSAAALVPDLPGHDGGGDQPAAVRPARGRGRAGRRVPHRVLVAEVRAVLPGRVRQHDHGVRRWPSRCSWAAGGRPWPISRVGRGQQRLVADAVVPGQGLRASCSSSSGCAARCPGSGTTS